MQQDGMQKGQVVKFCADSRSATRIYPKAAYTANV